MLAISNIIMLPHLFIVFDWAYSFHAVCAALDNCQVYRRLRIDPWTPSLGKETIPLYRLLIIMRWQVYRLARLVGNRYSVSPRWAAPLYHMHRTGVGLTTDSTVLPRGVRHTSICVFPKSCCVHFVLNSITRKNASRSFVLGPELCDVNTGKGNGK